MKRNKRILVAPLDWGLGHATRCMPVILELQRQGAEVVIASDGRSYQLLSKEFPDLLHLPLPGYQVSYQKKGSIVASMLLQLPKLLKTIYKEHKALQRIIRDYQIDAVISDNRYGLWTQQVPCILMTHQLFIQLPLWVSFLQPLLNKINAGFISQYSACWIPDFAGDENLSGILSHNHRYQDIRCHFIGPLSRLYPIANAVKKYDLLVVLSGPEPQRTIFENIILSQIDNIQQKTLVVRGVTEQNDRQQLNEYVEMVSYLNAKELNEAMNGSSLILSRAGYSTVMDLAMLGKKAALVPTPGQTEQEYLAKELKKKKIFYSVSQKEFVLHKALEESNNYTGFQLQPAVNSLLTDVITHFLHRLT